MRKINDVKSMILEFKRGFPYPNLRIYKNHPEVYEIALVGLHFAEFNRGYKVVKIGKPNSKGIELIFRPFSNEEDVRNYLLKIKTLMNDFNKKKECLSIKNSFCDIKCSLKIE